MKSLKKIGALVLAVMMTVAAGAAWAADGADSNADWNPYNGIENSANTIRIAKEIIFVNSEATTTSVREPNITYTYTIDTTAPGTAGIKGLDLETDTIDMASQVKAGPLAAVEGKTTATTSTVAFADTNKIGATANGTADTKYAEFEFTPSRFTAPGIYRYVISETQNKTKASVGVTEAATYSNARFLDVYVKWNTGRTALEIYGYVLFEGSQTDTLDHTKTADLTKKSHGFVNKSTTAGTQEDVDVYKTENLLISKTTTGAMADKNNSFPVTITFTKATGLNDGIKMDYVLTNGGALTKKGTDATGDYVTMDAALAGTVKDGSTITITGIPYGSSVVMTETNNTYDSYRVKAGTTSGTDGLLTENTVAGGATSSATTSQTLNAKKAIYLTNTLDVISPTGYVSRFAPYALMLICGVAMLIIAVKRKHHKEDE